MSRKTSILLAAVAAPLITSSALAYDITSSVLNAGFEHSQSAIDAIGTTAEGVRVDALGNLLDGQDYWLRDSALSPNGDVWKDWANRNNGGMAHIWNPSAVDRSSGTRDQFFDASWGGVASEGQNVLAIRTQHYNYDGSTANVDSYGNLTFDASSYGTSYQPAADDYFWGQADGATFSTPGDFTSSATGGNRAYEAAAQKTTEVFDSTARYILTVEVGRLSNDGWNAGYVTAKDNTSKRFVNDATPDWNGYFVDLMAGGIEGHGNGGATTNTDQAGFIYGVSDDQDPGYIESLAKDDQLGSALAADTWETSTIDFAPTSATAAAAAAVDGLDLVIRLGIYEPANHLETAGGAFDDIQLQKFEAGDANLDGDVNGTDLAILASGFGTATAGGWDAGDFNGDGDIDGTDLARLASNFGFVAGSLNEEVGISLEEAYAAVGIVPEPNSLALLALGGLMLVRRRRSL